MKMNIAAKKVMLHRTIGLSTGISIILNCIIGSGIFISPKSVLVNTNSIGMCLIFWVICAIVTMLGALCYAELGNIVPESGADLIYILRGFSLIHTQLGRILAFLNAWSSTIILKPSAMAIQSLTCANYLLTVIIGRSCGGPARGLVKITAVVVLSISSIINATNIKLTQKLLVSLASVKVLALAVVILGGIYRIAIGHTENFQNSFRSTTSNVLIVSQAFYGGLYAYSGWQNLNSITEEIKNPKRNLPLSIFIGLAIVAFVYILTNVSYFTVMNSSELLASEVVALTWADSMFSSKSFNWIVSILISISSFGSLTGIIYASTRSTYVAARESLHPKVLSMINIDKHTPQPSILLSFTIAVFYLIPADVGSLINIFGFMNWFFIALTIVCFIILRFKNKNTQTSFQIPLAIPFIFLAISVFITLVPIMNNPKIEYLAAIGIILLGFIFYIPFEYFELKLPYYDQIELVLRNLLEARKADKAD